MKCMSPAKTKNGPKSLPMRPILLTEVRLGLCDGEALLVERPADDHAGQVVDSKLGEGAQVVQGAHSARVDQLAVGRLRGLAERVEIGALHQPVDLNGGVDEAADAAIGEPRDDLGGAEVRGFGPALGGDSAGTGIDGGDD